MYFNQAVNKAVKKCMHNIILIILYPWRINSSYVYIELYEEKNQGTTAPGDSQRVPKSFASTEISSRLTTSGQARFNDSRSTRFGLYWTVTVFKAKTTNILPCFITQYSRVLTHIYLADWQEKRDVSTYELSTQNKDVNKHLHTTTNQKTIFMQPRWGWPMVW